MKKAIAVAIAIGVGGVLGTGAFAARPKGNIPKSRLDDKSYTSWDGGFELTLPPLIMPGAKAEERRISPAEMGVFFVDDFGTMYYVLRTDNAASKQDLETIAAGYTLNESLREGSALVRMAWVTKHFPVTEEIRASWIKIIDDYPGAEAGLPSP